MIHKSKTVLAATMLLAALVAACQQAPSPAADSSAADEPQPQVVTVTLKEYSIDMPKSLSPGVYTFAVTNAGRELHNFRISGMRVNEGFGRDLRPGDTKRLTVTLDPGFYKVMCPIAEHADKGMRLNLQVQ